ncbi:MAG: 3-hydroxyacyl-ACP dehydratase FabZ family protein [Bacteroidota bacterium]
MAGKVYVDVMDYQEIIDRLPYREPFLFVDRLLKVNAAGVEGEYTFSPKAFFYQGHFKEQPVTPGVLLTECCAQIGLVALGIFLLREQGAVLNVNTIKLGLTNSQMEFVLPVYPNEKVFVVSQKQYFRFNKLKCKVKMYNAHKQLVCTGTLAGMFKVSHDEK